MKINKLMMLGFAALSINVHAQNLQVRQPLSPSEAVVIAQHRLPDMLQLIEPDQITDFGFTAKDDFSSVEIGRPFYVAMLPKAATREDIAVDAYTILLPVILNGTARCVLHVSPENGTWKVVGIGERGLIANNASIFNTTTKEDGSSQVLVYVPQMSQMYFMEKNSSFKPLLQHEGAASESISMDELVKVSNTIPAETSDQPKGQPTQER